MLHRILADGVLALHLMFILYVLLGGFMALRWPRTAWVHVPVFIWGGMIEIGGWACPLTYLEVALRSESAAAGYRTSFVEHYLLPVIYPGLLFPEGIPRGFYIALGVCVLALNGIVYWRLWRRRHQPLASTE